MVEDTKEVTIDLTEEDDEMNPIQLISFQIISAVGTARSNYIAAIDEASEGNFEEAERLVQEGKDIFNEGHVAHAELLTKMANGELEYTDLLLTHAEDQLMSAEGFGILAEKFIKLYKKMNG